MSADTADSDGSTSALSEEHHDWASAFTGIETRAGSVSAPAGGGFFSGIVNSVSNAASSVSSAVSQAASSVTEAALPASTNDHETDGGSSSGVLGSIGSMASSAGNALIGAGSAVVDGAKSTYNAVAGTYDAVAPNFTKANQDLGGLVDAGEAAVKKGNDAADAQLGDVPVLGSLVKASSWLSEKTTEAVGGVVKGVGDLAAAGGNAIFHPIDAAVSLGEGALGIAEHVPIVPGLNTTVKGIHGLVDLAEGKKDGEYGSNLTDLGENLLLDTKQDPNDPSKRTNADIDFAASFGGGTKAWSEKPVEAATRTITDLAPMLFGGEGDTPAEPPPPDAPPPPEGPPPDVPSSGPPSDPPSSQPALSDPPPDSHFRRIAPESQPPASDVPTNPYPGEWPTAPATTPYPGGEPPVDPNPPSSALPDPASGVRPVEPLEGPPSDPAPSRDDVPPPQTPALPDPPASTVRPVQPSDSPPSDPEPDEDDVPPTLRSPGQPAPTDTPPADGPDVPEP